MRRGKRNKEVHGSGKIINALRLLAESGAKYLIVGGVAANLHGISRGTRDIDLLIPKDIENTEKILKALSNLTWGIAKEIDAYEVITKPFTIIGDLPRVDLLLIAGKLKFEDAYKNRKTIIINGVKIQFVSLDDLIKSKQTNRPNDKIVVNELNKIKKLRAG